MNSPETPNSNDDFALTISIIALVISIAGWAVSYWLGVRATNLGRKTDTRLRIYFELLDRTNDLIKEISTYTTSSVSHTSSMAMLLNQYTAEDMSINSNEVIDKKYELKIKWLEAAYQLSDESFVVQRSIEDYMRYLDMNGTDYSRGTKMFNALQEIKQEAYVSAENNRLRWSDPSEMDKITPEGYKKKSNETQKDADTIFDFGMCLDDVLLHAYNNSIAEHLDKPKKKLEMIERRRYLTEDGFVDKRKVRGKNK